MKLNSLQRSYFQTKNCVVCGQIGGLSRHHVVPYCIERLFPQWADIRNWHLLLCLKCHERAEEFSQPIFNPILLDLQSEFWNRPETKELKGKIGVSREVQSGNEIPLGKLTKMLIFARFLNKKEALEFDFEGAKEVLIRDFRSWQIHELQSFIEEHGGVFGVRAIFKKAFLDMEPKFLPAGSLENSEERAEFVELEMAFA